mgnify:CR=1 FL=1
MTRYKILINGESLPRPSSIMPPSVSTANVLNKEPWRNGLHQELMVFEMLGRPQTPGHGTASTRRARLSRKDRISQSEMEYHGPRFHTGEW